MKRSPKQKAAAKRTWRILRLKGVIAFLTEMSYPQEHLDYLHLTVTKTIEYLHKEGK